MASTLPREAGRLRRPRAASEETRAEILTAAIASIQEAGYYRGASSNAIAKRAGLTWGVIQHHFGSRKALLLAVLENELEEAIGSLTAAEVTGNTVEARLESVVEILFTFFGQPGYNAILQII
jgi:AcrR family transcriptional regulator